MDFSSLICRSVLLGSMCTFSFCKLQYTAGLLSLFGWFKKSYGFWQSSFPLRLLPKFQLKCGQARVLEKGKWRRKHSKPSTFRSPRNNFLTVMNLKGNCFQLSKKSLIVSYFNKLSLINECRNCNEIDLTLTEWRTCCIFNHSFQYILKPIPPWVNPSKLVHRPWSGRKSGWMPESWEENAKWQNFIWKVANLSTNRHTINPRPPKLFMTHTFTQEGLSEPPSPLNPIQARGSLRTPQRFCP